jgi:pantothenate kinase
VLDINLSRLYNFYSSCRHKVVVVEGNYLLLSEGDWKDLESIFDERWFIEIDIEEAMNRVEKRHIATGISSNLLGV